MLLRLTLQILSPGMFEGCFVSQAIGVGRWWVVGLEEGEVSGELLGWGLREGSVCVCVVCVCGGGGGACQCQL